jgi:phospholipid transport system substrate-binding protein
MPLPTFALPIRDPGRRRAAIAGEGDDPMIVTTDPSAGASAMWWRAMLAFCLALALTTGAAPALDTATARQHVDETIEEIVQLIVDDPAAPEAASRLLQIVERRASIRQVARFAAGRYWRGMSEAEQAAFADVLSRYLAGTYVKGFGHVAGSAAELRRQVRIRGAQDAGRKGVLVRTEIAPPGIAPIAVDWLVSDQSGRVQVADLIVEGISMAITQREVVGAMLEARGGDVARLLHDLRRELDQQHGTARP